MGEILKRLEEGIGSVALAPELKAAAVANARLWLEDARFEEYRPALLAMVQRSDFKLLADSFYRLLPFGTGGRRGAVGIGPNRMNPYTVTTSVQGHCEFLRRRFPGQPLTVVVASDVRRFLDLKNNYDKSTLGRLLGLSSKDLSKMAASVYAANGVTTWMADPDQETYISTPELSFLIYNLKAHGGLNMSASHNHPDDNGAKFYNAAGGQEVPPYDEELVGIASTVLEARAMPFEQAVKDGLVRFLTSDSRHAYIRLNLGLSQCTARKARVAFSPLHGTGITTAYPVLKEAGFDVRLVESQAAFDGAFPNVPFRIPNPEVPSAMEAAITVGREQGCDLAMATDPDADRLGVALPERDGSWRCLTGNQIGLLVAYHLLVEKNRGGTLTPASYVIKTEVTTGLLARMAEQFGIRCIGHLLVGFKYIGDVLDQVARNGRWGAFAAAESDFVMAMEESHGYLATPLIRDKDAANAALLVAELAARCKEQGIGLLDLLKSIYKRFGYFGTALKSVVMEGAVGLDNIRRIQESLRRDPPAAVGGRRILAFHDRQDEKGVFGRILSETDRASRDVLVFELEGNVRVTLRPSGTEPKNKTYAELAGVPLGEDAPDAALDAEMARVNAELKRLLNSWEVEMLERIGARYPCYATRFSDSLSLDRKMLFVATFEPELRKLAQGGGDAAALAAAAGPMIDRVGHYRMLRDGLAAMGEQWPEPGRKAWAGALSLLDKTR